MLVVAPSAHTIPRVCAARCLIPHDVFGSGSTIISRSSHHDSTKMSSLKVLCVGIPTMHSLLAIAHERDMALCCGTLKSWFLMLDTLKDMLGIKFVHLRHFKAEEAAYGTTGGVGTHKSGMMMKMTLDEELEEATLSYKVKFDGNYDWTAGGKLPGLCDTGVVSTCCTLMHLVLKIVVHLRSVPLHACSSRDSEEL